MLSTHPERGGKHVEHGNEGQRAQGEDGWLRIGCASGEADLGSTLVREGHGLPPKSVHVRLTEVTEEVRVEEVAALEGRDDLIPRAE